jgi:hypothetical protein
MEGQKFFTAAHFLNGCLLIHGLEILTQLLNIFYFVIRNYDAEIFAFSNRLGEKFNEATLRTALTHKSYVERETARLSDMGVDSHLQIQNNEELAVAGGEMISKFTNGYLRAVFTRVPEELIMYDSYSILPNV